MNMDPSEVLRAAFDNLIQRKVSPEQIQDFIDRSRAYHQDNPDMAAVLDELQALI